jgi:excisionase family DNA binding protein
VPAPKARAKPTLSAGTRTTAATAVHGEVLTLAEAAAYLRVSEKEVLRLVREQGLPGRNLGGAWSFLKTALQDCLRAPPSKKQALLMQIGAFEDDPDLEEMLAAIHRQRGRPTGEAD